MSPRNPEIVLASLRMMRSSSGNRIEKTDRAVLWLLLALGAILMLVAAGTAAAEESATRTDRFTASMPAGSTLRVENVSGDLTAGPGPEFAAVATIVVAAPRGRGRRRFSETSASSRRETEMSSRLRPAGRKAGGTSTRRAAVAIAASPVARTAGSRRAST